MGVAWTWEWGVLLAIAGFGLLIAELFVPGAVLGVLGVAALAASVAVVIATYGPLTGGLVLVAEALILAVGLSVWVRFFPRTRLGRKVLVTETNRPAPAGAAANDEKDGIRVGAKGVLLTPCRPAGTAVIEGRRTDVVSESPFLEARTAVAVVEVEGRRVVVREVPQEEPKSE